MDRLTNPARRPGSWQAIVGTALSAFLLGALVVGYALWDGRPTFGGEAAAPKAAVPGKAASPQSLAAPTPTPSASTVAKEATAAVARVAEQQGGLDQRIAAAEQRIARLDLQAQAATGNAARAEGLLIAFAARRTLDRGADLGYLADQLRLRFGDALPNSVETVIAASRNPVTLDQLIARLDGLAPKLAQSSDEPSFARFKRELSELFVIRRESSPSPQPERRLERARWFLESGRIDAAIEEVSKLPGAEKAAAWIADAKRYSAAQHALDRIETSAVLEPRQLRDRTGQKVEQPSPVTGAATN